MCTLGVYICLCVCAQKVLGISLYHPLPHPLRQGLFLNLGLRFSYAGSW